MRRMMTFLPALRHAAVPALLLLLAACDTTQPPFIPAVDFDQQPASVTFQLNFVRGSAALAPGEATRLSRTLGDLGVRKGDDIIVRIGPSGNAALDQARASAAAAALAGTPAHVRVIGSGQHPLGSGPAALALVEVTRFGTVRVVCPTPMDAWETDRLLVSPPVGCSNAVNLAEMAARPQDLISPRPLRGSGGAVSAAAVLRHDQDKVKDPGSFENW